MLEKFSQAGVTKIFCGHYHRNAGGWYKEVKEIQLSLFLFEISGL